MRTSEQTDQLATALAVAQGEMKNATLNKINPHFKSKYADLAGIRDATIPHLAKNGLSVAQGTELDGERLLVVTRLMHKSGQWVESRFPIAIAAPQAMGSAYTYAKRYSLSAMCGIAADEDDDANAAQDTKPAMSPSNGTPGASKAANRGDFEKMTQAIRSAPTIKALDDWHKTNVTAIEKLPPDWVNELRTEFMDRKSELTKALAA